MHHMMVLLVLVLTALPARAAAALPLKPVADIPLPGDTSRFDYQAIDPATGRLFISHMGAGSVIAFDLKARKPLADLPGFPGATGITAVPSLHEAFVSVTGQWYGGAARVAAVDTRTLKTQWSIPAGRFPDGSAFVPAVHRLFVSDEHGAQELVIDTALHTLTATIPLDGEAGNTRFDPVSGRILVNVQTRNDIAVIDPTSLRIERRIGLPADCDNNHGLLIDGRRAFVACDGNATLMVLDLGSGTIVQRFATGPDPDVLALDPSRERLYVACESGIVSVFDVKGGAAVKLGEGFAGDNAHTIAVDPDSGLVYLPMRDVNGRPVLRIMEVSGP